MVCGEPGGLLLPCRDIWRKEVRGILAAPAQVLLHHSQSELGNLSLGREWRDGEGGEGRGGGGEKDERRR